MHEICVSPLFGMREPFSALSHLLGACVFAALTVELIRRCRGNLRLIASFGIMAYTTVQTLVCSSLYHIYWPGPWREFFLRADVAGIFLLTAGSWTPVHTILFRGRWRWAPLVIGWSVAITGALMKLTEFSDTAGHSGIIVLMVFGWGSAITTAKLWRERGWNFVRSPVLCGLTYTVGAVMLLLNQPTLIPSVIGPHEVWHVAVLCALGLTWQVHFRIVGEHAAAEPVILKFPTAVEAPRDTTTGTRRRAA